jgi:hypothetical protein
MDIFADTITADPARAGRLGFYTLKLPVPGSGTGGEEEAGTGSRPVPESADAAEVPEPVSSEEGGA